MEAKCHISGYVICIIVASIIFIVFVSSNIMCKLYNKLTWLFVLVILNFWICFAAVQNVTINGPGLQPDKIVMPARYFFVNFDIMSNELSQSQLNNLEIIIKGQTKNGQCRVWVNKLNRKDGTFIIRYKIYETCYDFSINVLIKGEHVGLSPYYFSGPIYADQCYCPEQNIDTWINQYGCTGDYQTIYKQLEPFQEVDMRVALRKIVERYHNPESTSYCHYMIKNNEVYRKCYGKHIGFNMFADSILLFLARIVTLPDMELLINLGDWPLVTTGKELLPIFSWCGSADTNDIVMPTYDITESTLENMGRVTLDMLSVQGNVDLEWENRKPQAFWRGRDSRAERLQLIDIARKHPELFNASLTNFFFFRDKETQYGPKQPHVSFYKFFDYKYQINVDGTVAAYRLPYLLAGGGLVLKQQSPYYEHFYDGLREWQHYIPIKRDLSDLVTQVLWARDHDKEAYTIAKNAQTFANDNLLPRDIICYHTVLFKEWSKRLHSKIVIVDDAINVPQPKHDCHCKQAKSKDEL